MTVKNTAPYLNDGSGCDRCNYTGRFGGWLNGKYSVYPQIACSHCAPRDERKEKAE